MIGDVAAEIVEGQSESIGLDDEMFDLIADEVRPVGSFEGGALGDDGSESRVDFEEALGHEFRDDFMGRIGVNLQTLAEGTNGRESLTRRHVAGEDGFLGSVDYLLVDGDARLESDAEWDHGCTVTLSTAKGYWMRLRWTSGPLA